MRKSTSKPKYTWQILVIIVTVIILGLSAIPTFYGSNNALLVSAVNPTQSLPNTQKLRELMQQQQVDVEQIINGESDSKIVIEGDDETLIQAQAHLKNTLGDDYQVRLGSQSAAPTWLQGMGMSPIKLGLDLSGGVLFVLEVDTNKADQERLGNAKDEALQIIHDQGLRGMSVKIADTENKINLHFLSHQAASVKSVVNELQQRLPGVTYSSSGDRDGTLVFSEQSITTFHHEIMAQALTTLRGRIEELGITEAVTQRQGQNRIRIELPGVKDPEQAKRIIGATASLDFYEMAQSGTVGIKTFTDENGRRLRLAPKPIFTGSNIENATSGRDEMGVALVNLALDGIGGKKMSEFSKDNIGNPMVTIFSEYHKNSADEMVKSSKVISVATIQSQLGNRFSITNLDSPQAASDLALLLRAGSLDAPITIVQQRTIQASLGQENVSNGIMALAIGLGITLLFMGLWYRKLGLIANTSLVLNLICLLGLMALLPNVVLTLPGIAGLVLTVGMAVDTNVLIFERIKEERKRGRSNFLAIETGYKGAFATILDANVTTMITALILLSIGYGPVKGFAMTLSLGILTSMFTGVFVAHVLTALVKPQIPVKQQELKS
ncbi:MAG: protein translocase subunit SecD [Alteromonadaceae bacterium]|uniref:protein translocase subunit SecD n=1 Tax=Paraglaciecola chathamensis TaxID=368405 RepID=UPI000C59C8CC|nr:protein translocase subunit SecD [Paraglaciecola agarilytica]MBN27455.1 protein translocase subunit SecD [Alteromonadaceae bacterium]|tara:strand:- start:26359 stop:28185 length:1827 start_codon:yes stop_codon:yes gene_type:complete